MLAIIKSPTGILLLQILRSGPQELDYPYDTKDLPPPAEKVFYCTLSPALPNI